MQFTGGPAREQRQRQVGMGVSFAPSATTARNGECQGRRVTLYISGSALQELNRLALDGVTTERLMRALDIVAIYESSVRGSLNVTTQTVARLEAVITTQMQQRVSRSQAVENLIRTPNNFLIAPAQSRGDFPARPAREGFGRDPFHPGGRGERRHMG